MAINFDQFKYIINRAEISLDHEQMSNLDKIFQAEVDQFDGKLSYEKFMTLMDKLSPNKETNFNPSLELPDYDLL